MLRSFAERIVRLEDERKALAGDIKDIKNEAAGQGYDKKALMIVVARIRESDEERAARVDAESLADVYLASLGMLGGTPLGDAARRRFDPIDDPIEDDTDASSAADDPGDASPPAGAPPAGAMSEATLAEARTEGDAAAAAGERIFANPYIAGDPRRAAWDEGWCARKGSDGMEIPEAFRRKKKPKLTETGDGAGDGAPQ